MHADWQPQPCPWPGPPVGLAGEVGRLCLDGCTFSQWTWQVGSSCPGTERQLLVVLLFYSWGLGIVGSFPLGQVLVQTTNDETSFVCTEGEAQVPQSIALFTLTARELTAQWALSLAHRENLLCRPWLGPLSIQTEHPQMLRVNGVPPTHVTVRKTLSQPKDRAGLR